ncbi:hypothetical protein CANCADRAFT_32850 [Tortispora caseinolytica NRRL Y-17796]|uniref:Uracil permease n=1 Tax=Tortispora caseinolytica NRRL Y-17796 TaxID=767744 RepID=A0A1E4TD42_9ASCO|nr:hypothetical protein CANCADRAFT_32850 [Tortispora caseinolytica NRRL Y-17796]
MKDKNVLKRFLKWIEIPVDPDAVTTTASYNRDTLPLPPSRRTYGPWQFVGLWIVTGSFNIGGWTTGSSIMALGLNVWQAMITVIVGHCMVAAICLLSGFPGAKWHIGFPILQKSSWGMYGGYFPLINRIFLSFIWYSTQVWWGGQCIKTFLTAIAPSYRNLNKPLANGTMTTGDFCAFVVFSILCLPIIWIPPERYHKFFAASALMVIPCVFALLGWCVATAGGPGLLVTNPEAVGISEATGSNLGWMFVLGIVSNIGGISTHIFSQSDFTRFARKPADQVLSQIVMVPLGTIVVSLIGIMCTSCAAEIFPDAGYLMWEPFDLLANIQSNFNDSSRSRCAVAFASICFIMSQFGIAVAENALSNGIDLSGLCPRYFNLHRGGYLTAAIAFVMQPWQLLNGASKFLSVVGGYAVFLGPFSGVMFADYYYVRRRNLKLTHLYEATEASNYWYTKGVNWRAPVCWIMGVWPLLPGFAWYVQHGAGPDNMGGWSHIYYLSWIVGCLISFTLYAVSSHIWKFKDPMAVDDEDYFGTFTEKGITLPPEMEVFEASDNSSLATEDQEMLDKD